METLVSTLKKPIQPSKEVNVREASLTQFKSSRLWINNFLKVPIEKITFGEFQWGKCFWKVHNNTLGEKYHS